MIKCPVCGQPLVDAKAQGRVQSNLNQIMATEKARHERELRSAEARTARVAKEAAQRARKDTKEAAGRQLAAERRRNKLVVEEAEARAKIAGQRQMASQVESMQKQIAAYQRQLQKLSANEHGEIGESEVLEALRSSFPLDKIERLGKRKEAPTSATRSGTAGRYVVSSSMSARTCGSGKTLA